MRKTLFASTCLMSIAAPAFANTDISTSVNGPVRTSTVKSGSPDDITITSTGTVTGGVVIDSNHKLTNSGTIQIGNVSGAVGVNALAGVASAISINGKIVVDEPYVATDADNDGDLDGPFATGGDRFGIRTNGLFTGNISVASAGSIAVEGNNSTGIHLGGPLVGSFSHDGSTSVLGNNAVGIQLSDVSGATRVAGSVAVKGKDAVAVRSTGNLQGALVVQGTVGSSGYRNTVAPTDSSKLDADDLLQGGPAIWVEGNVAKGIILAVAPKDNSTTDNDEDDDGIEDSKEGSAAVTSFGSAAALRIGSANAMSVGATENNATGFGLIIDGTALGDAVYTGVDANGLQVGGLGGSVTMANGIGITGGVGAKSIDRSATAIRLGAGASTGELRSAGQILASSGNAAAASATAVHIAAGATLPVLRNSGQISSAVGENGTATAIVDQSGSLTLVENSGVIVAKGAKSGTGRNVALDLSANMSGVTVRQTAVAANFPAPEIIGDVRFGSGSDTLDVADGKLAGDVRFGAGNNRFAMSGDAAGAGKLIFGSGADTISMAGTSKFAGNVDFGGGSDVLTIGGTSSFTGQLTNASGLAVTLQKGTFGVVKSATISSLAVSDGGTIAVTLDKTPGESSILNVTGAASFGSGSKLQLNVANVDQAEGRFVVLNAGTLTGGANIIANNEMLPFLYKGAVSVTGNQVAVDVARKSTDELGLNRSEAAAFPAIYKALAADDHVGDLFLSIRAQNEFQGTIRQMLPEHAGGTFEAVTMGDRTVARTFADPKAPFQESGAVRYMFSQVAWGSSKSIGDTAGYKIGGWGAAAGAEVSSKVGSLGATLSYLWGKDGDKATSNVVSSSQYSLAAHWRYQKHGLQVAVRGSYGFIAFDSDRFFNAKAGGEAIERTIKGDWNGSLVSASASASQELWAGSFFVRPQAGVEYYRLNEGDYAESGGGNALDLSVEDRSSSETAANLLLAGGLELGGEREGDGYFRLEGEFGRRQILSGKLGNTRARFTGGDMFVIEPEERESGWVGRLRGIGGGGGFRLAGEVGAEQRWQKVALSARMALTLGL